MHIRPYRRKYILLGISLFMSQLLIAQFNIATDLVKPKAYENRKLASELTPDKKINPVKRLKENIVSHYNFYFNANRKINAVVASAKQTHKDTFTRLLPFYNYSLDQTASQQTELDSVIIKSNNGILLHDLRNDWVDDLYFLMGQSYYYQKKFDSAYDVFQYINYNFQPRKKDEIGFEKNIGSNANENGNVFNVSTKESKLAPHRPIRNEALLWIIKTLIAQGNDDDARGLMETLQKDTQFPERLKPALAEIKAHWFYKQGIADSAAVYLEKSLNVCNSNDERARRHFLIAQLYIEKGMNEKADDHFEKSVSLTTDPVLEAYARIYQTGLTSNETDQDKRIDNNVKALVTMAGREKYASYRSLIYAAAAEMEIKRNGTAAAIDLLLKSNAFNENDPGIKNESNIKIAELAFSIKKYDIAKTYYDSINAAGLVQEKDIIRKKEIANLLYNQLKIVSTEDSLQRIALLPEKEREAYLKDLVRKLRKEQGLADESENKTGSSTPKNNLLQDNTSSLFPTDQKKGEWYFNNPSLKAQGAIAFKNKWGERPNADNWRRSQSLNSNARPIAQNNLGDKNTDTELNQPSSLSVEGLMENLPLTTEKMDASNDKRFKAFRGLALVYKDKLGFCQEAIEWNEKLLSVKPDHPELEKILFDLAYCYRKSGNESKASFYQNQLTRNFPSSNMTGLLKDPVLAAKKSNEEEKDLAKTYTRVYDMFLSGKFKEAIAEKTKTDSLYPQNKWTPQLLYIEAVYYVKNRLDSQAVALLNQIPANFPNSPLAEKAGLLADVVNRRESIENELRSMTVVRQAEDSVEWIEDKIAIKAKPEAAKKESKILKLNEPPVAITKPKADTIAVKQSVVVQEKLGYSFNPAEPHAVFMLLNNVDIVFVNEAKRALTKYNGERFASAQLNIRNDQIGSNPYILISPFANANEALAYVEKTAPIANREIFPWLGADKYKFWIVSPDNLKRMMEEKKTDVYLDFIKAQLPGKF
ncbi:MAG: tetratricopeptide repeat protein [Chitinophagia bacterium]